MLKTNAANSTAGTIVPQLIAARKEPNFVIAGIATRPEREKRTGASGSKKLPQCTPKFTDKRLSGFIRPRKKIIAMIATMPYCRDKFLYNPKAGARWASVK